MIARVKLYSVVIFLFSVVSSQAISFQCVSDLDSSYLPSSCQSTHQQSGANSITHIVQGDCAANCANSEIHGACSGVCTNSQIYNNACSGDCSGSTFHVKPEQAVECSGHCDNIHTVYDQ